MLHVYANEAVDWFVAESAAEAMTLYRQWLFDNCDTCDESEISEFRQCADDKVIAIVPDEDQSLPAVKKTCVEWALSNGKGFLCTENF